MTPATPPRIKPSAWWIALAILLMVGGPAGCAAFLVSKSVGLIQNADHYGRFPMPVEGSVIRFPTKETDGTIWVDVSRNSAFTGVSSMSLTGADGTAATIDRKSGTTTISVPDGNNQAKLVEIAEFTIDRPGNYRLTVSALRDADNTTVWVGKGGISTVVSGSGPWVLLGFGGVVAGVALLAVVVGRRRRARRAFGPPSPPSFGPPPGSWQPPPPGYGPPAGSLAPPPTGQSHYPAGWSQMPAPPPVAPPPPAPVAPPPTPGTAVDDPPTTSGPPPLGGPVAPPDES